MASPPAPLPKRKNCFGRGEKCKMLCSPSPDDALGLCRQERGLGVRQVDELQIQ